ncbi:unnamed protein product [Gongylonema pulchrum]|uniref:Vesicle-trafficking protein SEC22b n=1 Tax=Gongylonema pulchrum TaxID=637853 RepID=A0A183ECB8_9BILA|nr:unnamed protein product [Gongylonema pulchrum]
MHVCVIGCIRYDARLIDANVNIRTELYHQLGTLLKSALVASRMTPAYRYYVRKQSAETFVIMYRVYEKEPEMDLGDEQRRVNIGVVASPFGGFRIDLHYRTKMEITRLVKNPGYLISFLLIFITSFCYFLIS